VQAVSQNSHYQRRSSSSLVRFSFKSTCIARYLVYPPMISPYPRILTNGCIILAILGPPVALLASPCSCFRFVLPNSLISWFFGRQSWFCNSRLTFLTHPPPPSPLSRCNPSPLQILSICYGMALLPSSEIYAIYASYQTYFPPLRRLYPLLSSSEAAEKFNASLGLVRNAAACHRRWDSYKPTLSNLASNPSGHQPVSVPVYDAVTLLFRTFPALCMILTLSLP